MLKFVGAVLLGLAMVGGVGANDGALPAGMRVLVTMQGEGHTWQYLTDERRIFVAPSPDRKPVPVPGAELDSFVILNENGATGGYALDKKAVYWGGVKVVEADPATFAALGSVGVDGDYGKDARKVFYNGKPLAGVDAATFKTYLDMDGKARYGMDKSHFYENGQMVGE